MVGHGSTSGTETVYRHEIRPALTKGRHGHEPHPQGQRRELGVAQPGKPLAPRLAPTDRLEEDQNPLTSRDGGVLVQDIGIGCLRT
jgi:hypothetical protein